MPFYIGNRRPQHRDQEARHIRIKGENSICFLFAMRATVSAVVGGPETGARQVFDVAPFGLCGKLPRARPAGKRLFRSPRPHAQSGPAPAADQGRRTAIGGSRRHGHCAHERTRSRARLPAASLASGGEKGDSARINEMVKSLFRYVPCCGFLNFLFFSIEV